MSVTFTLTWFQIVSLLLAIPGMLFLGYALTWSVPMSFVIFQRHSTSDLLSGFAVILAILVNFVFLVLYGGFYFGFHVWGLLYATAFVGALSFYLYPKFR